MDFENYLTDLHKRFKNKKAKIRPVAETPRVEKAIFIPLSRHLETFFQEELGVAEEIAVAAAKKIEAKLGEFLEPERVKREIIPQLEKITAGRTLRAYDPQGQEQILIEVIWEIYRDHKMIHIH